MLEDVLHLIFPNNCLSCGNHLMKQEETFCSNCEINFPYTRITQFNDNIITKVFTGRCRIEEAYALVYFKKGGKTQVLLHELKYNNKPQIGQRFGVLMANEILANTSQKFDAIVPIPLHPKKEKTRGYNQSMQIAKGMNDILNVPINNNVLQRLHYNESQTNKNRFSRWENTSTIFATNSDVNNVKNILIVDDVITTGSTIEACVTAIHSVNPECKISVCAIGVAV
jgi:ComF family protein